MPQDKNLSESIADKIKKRIIMGEYAMGAQLPNEQELSDQLHVSRTTIREAVKLLVSRHILEIERGRGTFVAALPGLSDDPFGLDFVPEDRLVPDLSEFRRVSEAEVCALAAERATASQIAEMRQLIVKMEQAARKVGTPPYDERMIDHFTNCEIEFHVLIYKMSHNILFDRMSPLIARSVIMTYTSTVYREEFSFQANTEIHKSLFNAIAAHDSVKARSIGMEHTEEFLEAL